MSYTQFPSEIELHRVIPDKMGEKTLNFFWIITGGFLVSLLYFIAAIVFIATIFNYRTGFVLLKLARYSLTPFGQKWKNLALSDMAFEEGNMFSYLSRVLMWFPFLVTICAVHIVLTFVLCVTIAGVPLARTHYTLIRFATFPMIESQKTRDACLFCD